MSLLENEARKQIPFDAIVSEIQNCHSTRRSPCHKFIVQAVCCRIQGKQFYGRRGMKENTRKEVSAS